MKLTVDQAQLAAAMAQLATVADKRGTMPMLANALITAHADKTLTLAATDTQIAITIRLDVDVEDPGACTLSVQRLLTLTKLLKGTKLTLETQDNHWVKITSGRNEFRFMGLPDSDFPALPTAGATPFVAMPAHAFNDLIRKTEYSASTDDSRPNLAGIHLESDGNTLLAASTDGHRLTTYSRANSPLVLQSPILIPRKGTAEARRLLDRSDADVELAITTDYLFARTSDTELAIKLQKVSFPPFRQVIPKSHTRTAVVDRASLIEALRQAAVFAPEKTRTIRLGVEAERVVISADNPDHGVARLEIDAELTGDPLVTGFNANYLEDALHVIDTPSVRIEMLGDLDPFVLKPTDDSIALTAVVMPMRI